MSNPAHNIHPIVVADVEQVFNQDFEGIFNGTCIIASTASGSVYQITLIGPTVEATIDEVSILARHVNQRRIKENGHQSSSVDLYVGIARCENETEYCLMFLDSREHTTDHTVMNAPRSAPLIPLLGISVVDITAEQLAA